MLNEDYIIRYQLSNPIKNGDELHLSLMLSDVGFSYSICQAAAFNVIEIVSVEFKSKAKSEMDLVEKLDFLFTYFSLLKHNYKKSKLSILHNDFALIPQAYGSNDTIPHLLSFSNGINSNKKIICTDYNGIKINFAVSFELLQFLERCFPNALIQHASVSCLNSLFEHHTMKHNNLLLVFHQHYIEISAKSNQQLLFYNVFSYVNSEDILYYLLFLLEQFQLNPLHSKLSVAGELEADSSIIKDLKKYVRHVELCTHHPKITMQGELQKLPQHYFHSLLNQFTCE